MYNPITISNFFIKEYGNENNITPMRLVKLIYLSHGWYLGLTGKALIDENPEAWKYGPVIPTVYHCYKNFGANPIKPEFLSNISHESIKPVDKKFLNSVWNYYKKYTAVELSAMTHQFGTPWFKTWNSNMNSFNGLGIINKQIPDNIIKEHFEEKIESIKQKTE
jgi:uncharacterized phage-associated protein